MGNEDIDLGLKNIWGTWFAFRKGKRMSREIAEFQYSLEKNLLQLQKDLEEGIYEHGPYRTFTVCENKKRKISVASVRDRIVHRLLYNYLVPIWDKTFIYDAWSCRKGKGLLAAIQRTQKFLKLYPNAYIWRADIKKFFDNVDHEILLRIIARRTSSPKFAALAKKIVMSSTTGLGLRGGGELKGIPIGNLTSQIFSNIYLNELDHFVKHKLKPKAYLRYGDDFLIFETNEILLGQMRLQTIAFLSNSLKLTVNPKNDVLLKSKHGLKFLGVDIWPSGRKLNKRNKKRISSRLNLRNLPSYHGLTKQHGSKKSQKVFDWQIYELI
jgi:RNA-directed DNA polymerase